MHIINLDIYFKGKVLRNHSCHHFLDYNRNISFYILLGQKPDIDAIQYTIDSLHLPLLRLISFRSLTPLRLLSGPSLPPSGSPFPYSRGYCDAAI